MVGLRKVIQCLYAILPLSAGVESKGQQKEAKREIDSVSDVGPSHLALFSSDSIGGLHRLCS